MDLFEAMGEKLGLPVLREGFHDYIAPDSESNISVYVQRFWMAKFTSDYSGRYACEALAVVKSDDWYRGVLLVRSLRDANTPQEWKRAWHLPPLNLEGWQDPVEPLLHSMDLMPEAEYNARYPRFGDGRWFDLYAETPATYIQLHADMFELRQSASY